MDTIWLQEHEAKTLQNVDLYCGVVSYEEFILLELIFVSKKNKIYRTLGNYYLVLPKKSNYYLVLAY